MVWGALIAAGVALAAQIISSQIEGAEEEDEAKKARAKQIRGSRVGEKIREAESYGVDMSAARARLAREGIDMQYDQRMDNAGRLRATGYTNGALNAVSMIGGAYDSGAFSKPTNPDLSPALSSAIDNVGKNYSLTESSSPLLSGQTTGPTEYMNHQPLTGQFYGPDNPLWARRTGFGYR